MHGLPQLLIAMPVSMGPEVSAASGRGRSTSIPDAWQTVRRNWDRFRL